MKCIFIFLSFFCFANTYAVAQKVDYGFGSLLTAGKPRSITNGMMRSSITLPSGVLPSDVTRKGYHLIVQDEFDGNKLDTLRWMRSAFKDDYPCLEGVNAEMYPDNVVVRDGVCSLRFTDDQHSNCRRSASEIKTFSTDTARHFEPYWFPKNSYIEFRVLMPFGECVGSAAWLYAYYQSKYNEWDIWETYGKYRDQLQHTYIFELPDKSWLHDAVHITYQNSNKTKFDFSKEWINVAMDWDSTAVNTYVNGVRVRHINLTDAPPCLWEWQTRDKFTKTKKCCYTAYPQPLPFTLRFNVGGCLGCNKLDSNALKKILPTALRIDYVRAYIKDGAAACDFINPTKTVVWRFNSYGGAGFSVPYFPYTKYEWSSEAFTFCTQPKEGCKLHSVWGNLKPNLKMGASYPVTVKVTFASGYIETHTTQILVISD